MDEARGAPHPPNRSAWSKVGETHAVIPQRGQRLNVIGALLSSGRVLLSFTPDELEQAIDKIGAGFGSEYKLTFC